MVTPAQPPCLIVPPRSERSASPSCLVSAHSMLQAQFLPADEGRRKSCACASRQHVTRTSPRTSLKETSALEAEANAAKALKGSTPVLVVLTLVVRVSLL